MRTAKTIVTGLLLATLSATDVRAADTGALVRGGNATAFALYGQLRREPGNVFFSPFSISSAMAMVYAGASGETAREMEHALHFAGGEQLHRTYGGMVREWNAAGTHGDYQLRIANAVWAQDRHPFLPRFLTVLRASYGADARTVSFATNPEEARHTINEWVEDKTNGKITNLVPPGTITPLTRLVLTNAIYFKGRWSTPFEKSATRDGDFYATTTRTVHVSLMRKDALPARYAEDATAQALELPYAGDRVSMWDPLESTCRHASLSIL